VFISVIQIDQGQLACFIDVTEQRQLENKIREQQKAELIRLKKTQLALLNQMQDANLAQLQAERSLREVEQRNAALEQFRYTISHDLRTPLVTIETFLGFLEQDLAGADQHLVANDMEHIRTATRRMNILLNDLGKLLLPENHEPVTVLDFNCLAEELGRLAAGPLKIHGTEFVIIPCRLSLYASHSHLIQIWQNLIENAIKYMGEQTQPVIEVGVEEAEQSPVFYVSDNGIGIAKQDQSKIFGLFDQLDISSPGSGLGLALVKRIVEMYGGQIWVESEGKGRGSCFKFTLPNALVTDISESLIT
jgi:signal transduction histidine kinase